MKHIGCLIYLISLSPMFGADSLPVGTWVRRDAKEPIHITMKVEAAGAGVKLTYTIASGQTSQVMTVLTQLDGKDVPTIVDGKPSGQTMSIRSIDSRHTAAVVKFQGRQMGSSTSEISLDGKALKIENTTTGADGKPSVRVEYWDKK